MKIQHLRFIFLVLFILAIFIFYIIKPKNADLKKYYSYLEENQHVKGMENLDLKPDLTEIEKCKKDSFGKNSNHCFLEFYRKYTRKHGELKALQHLSKATTMDSQLKDYCHYITHGIGEGSFLNNKGDLQKSFSFSLTKIFKNQNSCGNGFYHGIIIAYLRQTPKTVDISEHLKGFCVKNRTINNDPSICAHGLGHAINIYLSHDESKSIEVCKKVFSDDFQSLYRCLSGVSMETTMFLSEMRLIKGGIDSLKERCNKFTGIEQEVCYQGMATYVKDVNDPDNYVTTAKNCNTFPTPNLRLSCNKLTNLYAIGYDHSLDAIKVCQQSKTHEEEVECIGFSAQYFGKSVDFNMNSERYEEVKRGICRTLNYFDYVRCLWSSDNENMYSSDRFYSPSFLKLIYIKLTTDKKVDLY